MATAALAFVGAAAMFVLPPPKITVKAGAGAQITPAPPRKPPRNPADGVRTDWPALLAVISELNSPEMDEFQRLLADRRAAREAAAAAAANQDPDQPAKGGGFAPPWRFIGTIREGGELSALVEIDTKQRFLRAGHRSRDGYELISVSPDQLVVAQGRTRHTIRREASTRGQALITGGAFPSSRTNFPPDLNDGQSAIEAFRQRRAGGDP